jgi:hypothetical protein
LLTGIQKENEDNEKALQSSRIELQQLEQELRQ